MVELNSRAAKVVRPAGVATKTRRRLKQTTDSNHRRPVAENVLDRAFDPGGPNTSWVADVTSIPTREGGCTRPPRTCSAGAWWGSMGATVTSRLVVGALEMALARRLNGSSSPGLIAHSDRGSRYASEHYQRRPRDERITCGMSRRGNCWENAPPESFFASLEKGLIHGEDYATREQLRASSFEYLEAFYNRVRRHASLGLVAPDEYERTRNQAHR